MSVTADWRSGKTSRDENFPVASHLVAARHRPAILAFYRFARAADDAADHPTLPPQNKLDLLDELEATLFGQAQTPDAVPLRGVLAERGLSAQHPLDLLRAFRQDVEKRRYETWAELMDYCAVSAMPVGRFVLDVHGEAQTSWTASDALCAALQIINHLQDCGRDLRNLDRVYLPLDTLAEHGARVEDLSQGRASPELKAAIASLAERTGELLAVGSRLPGEVRDRRLSMEVAAIRRLAGMLVNRLRRFDPLSESVHLGKRAVLVATLGAVMDGAANLLAAPRAGRRGMAGARR